MEVVVQKAQFKFSEVIYGEGVVVFPGAVVGRPPMAPSGTTEIDYNALDLKPVNIGDNTIIGANSVIYSDVVIGKNCLIGDGVHIREGVVIGDNCIVGIGCKVGARTTISDYTRVMDLTNVASDAFLGKYVFIGPGVMMGNDNSMGRFSTGDGLSYTGPVIEDFVTIGMNATILPGIKVGTDSVVGAGAVVTKEVPPAVIVKGIPACLERKLIKGEQRCHT